jgi:hypothetical protein
MVTLIFDRKNIPEKNRFFNSQCPIYKLKGVTLNTVKVSYFVNLPGELIASSCLMHMFTNDDPKTQAKQYVANLVNTEIENVTILSIEIIMKII